MQMANLVQGKKFTANIQQLDVKGVGQATITDTFKNGEKRKLKLAITYTITGEKEEVEVGHKLKRRYKGHVTEVIEADESPTQPRCTHLEHCGRCSWQHIA